MQIVFFDCLHFIEIKLFPNFTSQKTSTKSVRNNRFGIFGGCLPIWVLAESAGRGRSFLEVFYVYLNENESIQFVYDIEVVVILISISFAVISSLLSFCKPTNAMRNSLVSCLPIIIPRTKLFGDKLDFTHPI